MKGFTLFGILLLVLFAPLLIQGQEVCPHIGGWEKSGENEQHVTIIINEDKIMFIPDAGWLITEICFKAGTDVYYRSIGSTSEIIVAVSPNGHNISHGAALMFQEEQDPTPTPTTEEPTTTPTEIFTQTPTSTVEFTQTPTSAVPTETPTMTPYPTETPTPWSGTPTPWPTKECTNPGGCGGTG